MFSRSVPALFALALLGFSGCGPARLDVSKTDTLDPGEAKSVICPPQSKPQTLTVEFESTNCEITVFVVGSEQVPGDDPLRAEPSKAIAKGSGKAGKFTADVDPNIEAHVIFRGASVKTEVKLHVTNKK